MPTLDTLHVEALRTTMVTFRDAVVAHAPHINRLNVYPVPDGDTGTNMARTLDAVVAEMERSGTDLAGTCHAISHGSLMGARGNSGVILSQILRAIAATLSAAREATACTVAEAFGAASAGAYAAVLKPVEGTILTVAREVADEAARVAAAGAPLVEVLRAARLAGQQALARTPEMLPVLKEAGVVDAGGAGFLLLLDAALHVVAGEPLPAPQLVVAAATTSGPAPAAPAGDQRYEVMYLLELDDAAVEAFKQAWADVGDSIVVVGGDGTWNCHVHTNEIGGAIEAALGLGGRPRAIRVTDLFEEVDSEHARREHAALGGTSGHAEAGETLPAVTCAVVAVASGDGLAELFGQLGVQGVVTGGQTMNPSTSELLDAVARVNADQVVVLPNNPNIVAVANQLDQLSDKVVVVVPTRSMPEGLAALVPYDPGSPAAANAAAMAPAAEAVVTGEVTQAVRDASSPAGEVHAGDWIGLARGTGIVGIAGTAAAAAIALLDTLVTPQHEIVTIVEGVDATAEGTSEVVAWLQGNRPRVDVERHRGGQPLYPYLFGIE